MGLTGEWEPQQGDGGQRQEGGEQWGAVGSEGNILDPEGPPPGEESLRHPQAVHPTSHA